MGNHPARNRARRAAARGAAWLAAFAAAFALPAPARAMVDIMTSVGFDKTYVAGMWTPIRVLLLNGPDPKRPERKVVDVSGVVRVTIMDREGKTIHYTQPIDLAANSKKLVEFEVMIPENPISPKIDVIDRRGSELVRTEIDLNALTGANQRDRFLIVPTVLLESDPNETVTFPCWVTRSANVKRIALEELPQDARGYDGVKLLAIRRGISKRLGEERQKALDDWLERGGQLIVMAPKFSDELKLDSWLKARLPAEIGTVREAAMGDLTPGGSGEKALLASWGEMRADAKALIDSPLGPIAVERRVGTGRIVAFALDPSSIPGSELSTPLGLQVQALLESMILSAGAEDVRTRHFWTTAEIDPKFVDVTVLPNKWIVAFLLIVFVAVVGPGNFWMLRKRRRLELAWVTIPALSGVFFVAVYGYGLLAKGGEQYYASAEVMQLRAGSQRAALYWTGSQFSPGRNNYEVKVPGGGAVVPLMQHFDVPRGGFNQFIPASAGFTQQQGGAAIAKVLRNGGIDLINPVEQWMMAFYQGERMLDIEGAVEGKVTLLGNGKVRLKIVNNSGFDLKRPSLLVGERRYPLPDDIANGQTAEWEDLDGTDFKAAPWTVKDDPFYIEAADKMRNGLAEAYPVMKIQKPQFRCRLAALQDKWKSEATISPAPDGAKSCGMVVVEFPAEIEGAVELSTTPLTNADTLRLEIYDFDRQNTSFFDYESQFCTLNDSWAEALIGAPDMAGNVRVAGGDIKIAYSAGREEFELQVFNYSRGAWEPVKGEGSTSSLPRSDNWLAVQLLPAHLNPFGMHARIRMESKNPAGQSGGGGGPGVFGGGRNSVVINRIEAKLKFVGNETEQAAAEAPKPRPSL